MGKFLHGIFGGSPAGVVVRLVLLSIVVGFILTTLHIDPQDIFRYFQDLFQDLVEHLWRLGLRPIREVGTYFLVGAVVVIPIWALIRLSRGLGGK